VRTIRNTQIHCVARMQNASLDLERLVLRMSGEEVPLRRPEARPRAPPCMKGNSDVARVGVAESRRCVRKDPWRWWIASQGRARGPPTVLEYVKRERRFNPQGRKTGRRRNRKKCRRQHDVEVPFSESDHRRHKHSPRKSRNGGTSIGYSG
jgi:hypothetical protein